MVNIKVKDQGLPNLKTTSATPMLLFNIITTIIISFIAVAKILIYLRVSEIYGMLAQLIFAALIDTFPFSIFFIIWLLIFCVLYKVMGSQTQSAASYAGIDSIFGYFFYNFSMAVGNV
jgi:hypothetical protein